MQCKKETFANESVFVEIQVQNKFDNPTYLIDPIILKKEINKENKVQYYINHVLVNKSNYESQISILGFSK